MKKILTFLCFMSLFLFPIDPASAQYYVEKGDTLAKIAKENNMSLKDIISLNPHIANPNRIKAGQYIITRSVEVQKDLTDYARSLAEITAYEYGGNNFPYEVDCSAWVKGIYKKFGVELPRTSAQQATTGQPVKFKDLQIGDLMFFSTRPDHKITHVGIFLGQDYWISNLNQKVDVEIMNSWGKWTQENFMWGTRYKL